MALFPAGASFLIYYPISAGTNFLGGAGVNYQNAMREGVVTRLFSSGVVPSYPNGTNPPVAVAGALPVPAIPVGYNAWGLRRIPGVDWLEVGDVVSIDPPMEKIGQAQATVLKSLAVGREYIPGFSDGDVVKVTARYSWRLYRFLDLPPVAAGDVAIGGINVPTGGLYRATTIFAILLPPNFGQGEVTFGSQINFAASLQSKGPMPFGAEDDKVIDLSFELKVTGPLATFPGL